MAKTDEMAETLGLCMSIDCNPRNAVKRKLFIRWMSIVDKSRISVRQKYVGGRERISAFLSYNKINSQSA